MSQIISYVYMHQIRLWLYKYENVNQIAKNLKLDWFVHFDN